MMSGLRSHLEYTITWVSERSGMASSLVFFMDCQPKRTAAPTSRNTRNFRFAENSIILLIIECSPSEQLLHAQDLPAVVDDEGFRIFFLCEGESTGRATVERQVLCMLHLIHVHSVVTAGHGAASVHVPGLLGVKIVPRGVITVSYTHLRAHETVLDIVC